MLSLVVLACFPLPVGAEEAEDYRATIGLLNLRENGYLRANGRSVRVGQVEARNGGYAPNTRDSEFRGKTIELKGIPETVSLHATRVGALIYGNDSGVAPEVETVHAFSDAGFVGTASIPGLLNPGQGRRPGRLGVDVLNNSWAGTFGDYDKDVAALRRLDYAIWRDDVVVVNSTLNESWRPFPTLLASSYNGLTAGRSAGSAGGVLAIDGNEGRVKPDLVVPVETTSDAAAVVSGAAALLISEARARDLEPSAKAIKAVLMAGAYRQPDWFPGAATDHDDVTGTGDRSPLSYTYGAGELRVQRAFHILTVGEQREGKSVARRGWATEKLSSTRKPDYFDVKYAALTPEFTAVLTWNRRFSKRETYDNLAPSLADMELELLRKVGSKKWEVFASSDSEVDNVEMIAIDNLPAGQYRLTVRGSKREEYALAWDADYTSSARLIPPEQTIIRRDAPLPSSLLVTGDVALPQSPQEGIGAPVPEPSSALLALSGVLLLAGRRRKA